MGKKKVYKKKRLNLEIKRAAENIFFSLIGSTVAIGMERFIEEKWSVISWVVWLLLVFGAVVGFLSYLRWLDKR